MKKVLTPIKVISVSTFVKLGLLINLALYYLLCGDLAHATKIPSKEHDIVIQPYDLHYTADLGGIKIQARHQLYFEDGLYRVKNNAKSFLGKVTEYGSFDISKDGSIVPLKYSKQRKTVMSKRAETQVFDWAKNTCLYTTDKRQGTMDIVQGHFDTLSLTQQLRLDLAFGLNKMSYTMIKRDKLKSYQFNVVGRELMTISNGTYNSLVVERIENNSSKKTRIWFASDWDYVPLKIETYEKKGKKVMVLDKGIVNTLSIVPINNTTEIQE
jgi:hypothetical protein